MTHYSYARRLASASILLLLFNVAGAQDYSGCDCACGNWGKRITFSVGGVIDSPINGVMHTGDDASVTAGALGIDPGVLAAATPVDLDIDERGFDDIYSSFGGFEANVNMRLDSGTTVFAGYRYLRGNADQQQVGNAIADPAGANLLLPLLADFSEFKESTVQFGFLSSSVMDRGFELLWGARAGVGFVDGITGTFTVPGVTELVEVPFYEDSTILSFGVNLGFDWQISTNFKLRALSGVQYRTGLEDDDGVLPALGLDELNNGSGFASIPVYIGGVFRY